MEDLFQNLKLERRFNSLETNKNNFRFQEVVGNLEVQEISKPFKKLKFENSEDHHPSQQNIKKSDQSELLSDFSFSFEEPKEKEFAKPEQKLKILNKPSPKSKKTEKFSTIYTLSSDSSKLQEDLFDHDKLGSTKITQNEEKENFPTRSKEYLEFLPAKKYCKNCAREVNTTVKMEMPTVPL
jgi:hypothetical protein